jgi:acetyl-CoA carboxylase biotin carboxyl carrier protein
VSDVTAPMAGKIIEVKVEVGDTVNENDELIIIEAMKMEMPIVAPISGKVTEVKCKKGDSIATDDLLIVIE